MENEDDRGLFGTIGLAAEKASPQAHVTVLPQTPWTDFSKRKTVQSGDFWGIWRFHRRLRCRSLALILWILAVSIYVFARQSKWSTSRSWSSPEGQIYKDERSLSGSPFTGAFARFPRVSALPKRQRRITMVGVWDDDSFPKYMRHFFYTIQLNADVLDLVMINRLRTSESQCLDFEKAGVNITWGGNIHFHCIDDKEWKRRHVDFLCSSKYGWDCNATEYDDVMVEFRERQDKNYNHWRPLRGYVFRDLFPTPENPFWAWIDHDVFVGNFARYPFNILSQLSILTGSESMPQHLIFMAGQLTAFNLDDQALATAWKKFPPLKSVQHFTKYVEEKMPESSEERYWSYGYLRSDDDLPGSDLSYAIYPDIHGDDYFDGRWNPQNSKQVYVISGRDILLVSATYTRAEIEDLIEMERRDPIDDLGGIGWTGGEDGSAYLLDFPNLNQSEAINLAIVNNSNSNDYFNKDEEEEDGSQSRRRQIHQGILTSEPIQENCTSIPKWKQCLPPHALTLTSPPIFRSSLIHFKEQKKNNHIFRRLERDDRSRGYERKLLKHHLKLKKELWFEFPDFEITRDLVMRYNCDFVEVWRVGGEREETLFWRAREG